jgi:type I restriction enzyme M protein
MQTNREDVGTRYHEILIPIPKSATVSAKMGMPFNEYFTALQKARLGLRSALTNEGNDHHIFFA